MESVVLRDKLFLQWMETAFFVGRCKGEHPMRKHAPYKKPAVPATKEAVYRSAKANTTRRCDSIASMESKRDDSDATALQTQVQTKNRKDTNMKQISRRFLLVLLAISMVLACTVVTVGATDTLTIKNGSTTVTSVAVTVGDAPVTLTAYDGATALPVGDTVVWTTSAPSIASVTTKYGQILPWAAGTATITATYYTDDTQTTVLGTGSVTVTVSAAAAGAYGFQGNNGNTMILYSTSDIAYDSTVTSYYSNTINPSASSATTPDAINPVDGRYRFNFTMTAGINNFQEQAFLATNMPQIKIYDEYGNNIIAQYDRDGVYSTLDLTYDGFSNRIISFSVDAGTAGLAGNTQFQLRFGADIQGNNAAKTLGSDVVFKFKTA